MVGGNNCLFNNNNIVNRLRITGMNESKLIVMQMRPGGSLLSLYPASIISARETGIKTQYKIFEINSKISPIIC
jgi:hypothetical protein